MNTLKQQTKGFTIIEVVLVLAIAGLIFLMVFIAFPALQRNQRDGQRRSDVGRMLSQVSSYQTDNRGAVPATQSELVSFIDDYLTSGNETFKDPSGDDYVPSFKSGGSGEQKPDEGHIWFHKKATCGSGGEAVGVDGARKIAIRVRLEGGGIYCQNN